MALLPILTTLAICMQSLGLATATMVGEDSDHQIHVDFQTTIEPKTHTVYHPGTVYISVHFAKFRLREGDVVIVRSPTDSVNAHYYTNLGRSDRGLHEGGFYASAIHGDTAIIEFIPGKVHTVQEDTYYGYQMDKYAHSRGQATTSSVCGVDNSVNVRCLLNDAFWGRLYPYTTPVARLLINGKKACTGWKFSGSNHILTNNHCIANAQEADSVDIEFGAECECTAAHQGQARECPGNLVAHRATLISTNKEYDYALLSLDPSIDLSLYGGYQVRTTGPVPTEVVFIPQHPGGFAKKVTITNDSNELTRVYATNWRSSCGENRIVYDIDTANGASGSPVIAEADGLVIALHNCGSESKLVCDNSGVDIRAIVYELAREGVLPPGILG